MLPVQVVELKRGMVLHHADEPVKRIYFINRGMVSIVKAMEDGRMVEVSATGIEGMTTPEVLFGANAALLDGIVQIPGSAFVIERSELVFAIANDRLLGNLLQDYLHLSMQRLAQTAACNRLHSLVQRCSRWLLIAHDSARADTFPLTHEFLAIMLGVQRPGVSIAMQLLQKSGFVRYVRSDVSIADRRGLEGTACECYASLQQQLHDLFPRKHASA